MRHLINHIQAVKTAIYNALAYLPRKAHIALMLLLVSPAFSLASSDDFNSMADKWQNYFGSAKKLFWAGLALVGVGAFIYGLVSLVMINTKADYRGKMTNGKAVIIMLLGIMAAGGSFLFGVLANSLGATDAINNASSNKYTGFGD
ncbi:hypothetical protein [Cysteiniphilum marinum]|uniref:hypothetical protein n=1 Tax=Cysteiniphilum marinum TaxID=2774191 RepID=UPI00193A397F|nr:hypothetical protein [Cysteiniphilum marinum]